MNSQSELSNEHKALYKLLYKIPFQRKVEYRQINKGHYEIGKPRFRPPTYSLEIGLIKRVFSHFSQLKQYILSKNYEPRGEINSILDPSKTRENKFSPIFLLENDVWVTDAVYGDTALKR